MTQLVAILQKSS